MYSECYETQGTLYLCSYILSFPLLSGFIDLFSLVFRLLSYFYLTEICYELLTTAGTEDRGRGIF